ncbi:threonine/homoserine/homoserine lactone efflux protein [Vogesella perlucida]|nr:threonine/homoserine/homoserine lactone efflux protein [Vogesella perlucida]
MTWHHFILLAGAHFLALLSPGPDFFLLLNHTVAHGMRAGLLTALGIACANGVFIVAAVAGVSWLQDSLWAYWLVYVAGCSYLLWLGWQFWQAASLHDAGATATRQLGRQTAFWWRGVLSGLLNPKNALFYLTLFALLAGKDSTVWQRSAAGVWLFVAVLGWDALVCWALARPTSLAWFQRQLPLLHRASALLLWAVAAAMLWAARDVLQTG